MDASSGELVASTSRAHGPPANSGAWLLGGGGIVALVASVLLGHNAAGHALSQTWPPFVLVTGLILIGLVADDDGLFAAAGNELARIAGSGLSLFAGAVVLVGCVTAVLNLDTSVAFLTPVLVYATRSRAESETALLYGCLLLSNAGSLFLPGSNLTNLIVLAHSHLRGAEFLSTMWAPALVALVATAVVLGVVERKSLRIGSDKPRRGPRPVLGLGLAAIVGATLLVLLLRAPALPVAILGFIVVVLRITMKRERVSHVFEVLGPPTLVGLFGIAVALGTLGRSWSGPNRMLAHLDVWGTAAVAALSAVVVNNLPAAALLAARPAPHPLALLIGLNLGPNLFVTGSLAWLLWLRGAKSAGATPSIATASRLGALTVPISMAAALGVLVFMGSS